MWNKEPPSETGWYWWRPTPESRPTIAQVGREDGFGLRVIIHDWFGIGGGAGQPKYMGGEWQGPLVPPK